MAVIDLGSKRPIVHSIFVAPGAMVVGDVMLHKGTSVWFNAVLRGDQQPIEVGADTNIQDQVVLHAEHNPTRIGRGASIGHGAHVHGATVGDNTLIGMGAILNEGVVVGNNCFVASGAVLPPGMRVKDNSMVIGIPPSQVVRDIKKAELEVIEHNASKYKDKALIYSRTARCARAETQSGSATLSLLVLVGIVSGTLTGLLGIGGGLVMVPALLVLLQGVIPDSVLMKSCLATSLGVMVFTGTWASWLQYRAGNFDMDKVKQLCSGVALGALIGAASTAWAPELLLKLIFIAFAIYVGIQMIKPVLPELSFQFNRKTAFTAGVATGSISSLVGVGGGTIVVPFLTACKVDIRKATGISTGVGVAVALFSSVGYQLSAWQAGVEVPNSIGYVNLQILGVLVLSCMAGAVGGVKFAKVVKADLLKKIFAVVLLGSATKMAWSMVAG